MKIALLYPPPWKIPGPDEAVNYGREGPPEGYREGDLDGDFYQTPYGLFSLAAQARALGHAVKVMNLSAFRWSEVEKVIAGLDADLFGMSCWTANRRGVGYAAEAIKRFHPESRLVVGGPHAAPLAPEMLRHHPAIDIVTTGESDQTLLEIIERMEGQASMSGLAGAWVRTGDGIEEGPERTNILHLDALVSPQRYFDSHIFMTSRGCPWACTFCGAESQWGRGFRAHSVPYVLDALEGLVARLPVKIVLVKDDTFTTQKKRVIELCRGIRERGLRFLWSCDTRVDLLSDELLREMRLAGCERLSLGVESGAPEILRQVDKKITPDDILRSTALAKKYGIKVRYYMMLGNRGETADTFRQTLAFLERAQPHDYIFSCLSIYPGTRDFVEAEREGWMDREIYFEETFQELKVPFDANDDDTAPMNQWFEGHCGLQRVYRPTVEDCRAILENLGGQHAPAHLDLAGALFHAGQIDEAEIQARAALERDHPCPGLALNYLACIAVERRDYERMMDLFSEAVERDPNHYVLVKNVETARRWFSEKGPERGIALTLEARHDFQVLERTRQPVLPGPLPEDWQSFEAEERPVGGDLSSGRLGSNKPLEKRRRLEVI